MAKRGPGAGEASKATESAAESSATASKAPKNPEQSKAADAAKPEPAQQPPKADTAQKQPSKAEPAQQQPPKAEPAQQQPPKAKATRTTTTKAREEAAAAAEAEAAAAEVEAAAAEAAEAMEGRLGGGGGGGGGAGGGAEIPTGSGMGRTVVKSLAAVAALGAGYYAYSYATDPAMARNLRETRSPLVTLFDAVGIKGAVALSEFPIDRRNVLVRVLSVAAATADAGDGPEDRAPGTVSRDEAAEALATLSGGAVSREAAAEALRRAAGGGEFIGAAAFMAAGVQALRQVPDADLVETARGRFGVAPVSSEVYAGLRSLYNTFDGAEENAASRAEVTEYCAQLDRGGDARADQLLREEEAATARAETMSRDEFINVVALLLERLPEARRLEKVRHQLRLCSMRQRQRERLRTMRSNEPALASEVAAAAGLAAEEAVAEAARAASDAESAAERNEPADAAGEDEAPTRQPVATGNAEAARTPAAPQRGSRGVPAGGLVDMGVLFGGQSRTQQPPASRSQSVPEDVSAAAAEAPAVREEALEAGEDVAASEEEEEVEGDESAAVFAEAEAEADGPLVLAPELEPSVREDMDAASWREALQQRLATLRFEEAAFLERVGDNLTGEDEEMAAAFRDAKHRVVNAMRGRY